MRVLRTPLCGVSKNLLIFPIETNPANPRDTICCRSIEASVANKKKIRLRNLSLRANGESQTLTDFCLHAKPCQRNYDNNNTRKAKQREKIIEKYYSRRMRARGRLWRPPAPPRCGPRTSPAPHFSTSVRRRRARAHKFFFFGIDNY
ncbi:hypothetical protein EVAR_57168_1 [Eumeta japonica]|uniref:Uncharacterized protein n=1 Tax=Eumeta variegata TaxID=151549 RepID=A0A4C1ZW52_EUMVA|nr:hypothetical protein EVAR_57168_1 [Eumeta japonica]